MSSSQAAQPVQSAYPGLPGPAGPAGLSVAGGTGPPAVPGAESRSDEVLLWLCRVIVAATVRSGNASTPALSAMQIRTLTVLSTAPNGSSLNGVADVLGATASAASRICARLVRDGLLQRGAGPGNEIRLTLSPAGEQALAALNRARLQCLEPLFETIGPDQRPQVLAALEVMADAARAADLPW